MKYSGSKQRIAKYIVPMIQDCIDDNSIKLYVEPMVGGANLIDKIRCYRKRGFDINPYLIALLERVQNDLPLLDNIDRDFYNAVKNNKDKYDEWVVGNVGFLSSFNGKGFIGGYAKVGIEKTKNGERIRDYYRESKDNILKQAKSPLFKDISFSCADYRKVAEALRKTSETAMIVFDPPYKSTTGYDDVKFNHKDFWDDVRSISEKHYILVCEEQSECDFEAIWMKETLRSLNPNNKHNKTEKLFTHKDGLFYKYWKEKGEIK